MQSVDYSLPSIIVYEVKPHGLMDQTGRYFVIMNGWLSKAVPELILPGIRQNLHEKWSFRLIYYQENLLITVV